MENDEHTIDASGRSIGRVSSQAAKILMGKNRPDYTSNTVSKDKVKIINASKLNISPKKLTAKEYLSYSGYPGGQHSQTMQKVIEKKGYADIIRRAVYGMLPANRLRKQVMKNLIIAE